MSREVVEDKQMPERNLFGERRSVSSRRRQGVKDWM